MENQKENNENHTEDAVNTPADDNLEDQSVELDQIKDQLLRTMAELENVRKRSSREVEEAHKFAITGFCKNLLPIIDTLDRALSSVPADVHGEDGFLKTMYEGVELTRKEFDKTFEKFNIASINPKGEPFDPNLHQAVSEVPSEEVAPGDVVDVLQLGYIIEERLLRPAMVTVAKKP